jgi:hypothetical protein
LPVVDVPPRASQKLKLQNFGDYDCATAFQERALRACLVHTVEESLRPIRNFGCRAEKNLRACSDSDTSTRLLGKKEAGKGTSQLALPERPLGMADEVVVAKGRSYWHEEWTKDELIGLLPPVPEFQEPLELVREHIANRRRLEPNQTGINDMGKDNKKRTGSGGKPILQTGSRVGYLISPEADLWPEIDTR